MNEMLISQLQFNHRVAARSLDGITEEESRLRPEPHGNCINWVLGHIVTTRQALLAHFGHAPMISKESSATYGRGSAGNGVESTDTLAKAYMESQDMLTAALASLTEDDLAKPAPFSPGPDPDTLGTLLPKLVMHEGYHLGQIGLLRKQIGKNGIA